MDVGPTLFLCFITLNFLTICSIQATSSGFSINLIHRDSPLSPHYNSSNTYYENLRNSISRAMTRSSHKFTPKLASSPPTIQSPLTPESDSADYLMKISVGTPPLDFFAVADTGSDLTWIQCKPCIGCYKQNAPLFDPEKSSTYKKQPCQTKICQSFKPTTSCDDKNFCTYQVTYGDGSTSSGVLSSESFRFDSTSGNPVIFPDISFGCGHLDQGRFDVLSDGIVGLGNSDMSIVNQLSGTINGKFSYCIVPPAFNVPGKISFGSDAVVSGSGVQTTPILTKGKDPFYYLNLESVSIGGTNIKFETKKGTNNKAINEDGNVIIDSGTTISFLPNDLYQKIEDEFKRIIPAKPVKGEGGLRLCYKNEEGFKEKVPNATFHFSGGDWHLGVLNTMFDMEDGVLCLAMLPGYGEFLIFGNVQQINYVVAYDLVGKTLSFKKTDCTKQ